MDADVSSRMRSWVLVSPRYFFRKHLSVRAKTFQSTWRRSSPGVYARYSANSWLKPKSGERCRPATKPSTTVFATRSSPEIPASTVGSRKRCKSVPLGRRHVREQLPEDFVRIDAVRFGVEIQKDAV